MLPHFARFASTFKGCLVGTADHFALQKRPPFLRRYSAPNLIANAHRRVQTALRAKKKTTLIGGFFLVAEVGFEPHDLRVMSPTSYQAALLRDIWFIPMVPVTGIEPVRYFRITGF